MPIKLISTDFDGTLFAEFENPPVPPALQSLIGQLQTSRRQVGHQHWTRSFQFAGNAGPRPSGHQAGFSGHRGTRNLSPPRIRICRGPALEPRLRLEAHAELVRARAPRRAAPAGMGGVALSGHDLRGRLFAFLPDRGTKRGRRRHPRLLDWNIAARCQSSMSCATTFIPGFATKRSTKGRRWRKSRGNLRITAAETFAAGDHLNDLPMLSRICALAGGAGQCHRHR
jgi:hypothetical protein